MEEKDHQEMKELFTKQTKFETQANIMKFIELFGEKDGIRLWNEYKGRCNFSPLRIWRSMDEKEKEIFENHICSL